MYILSIWYRATLQEQANVGIEQSRAEQSRAEQSRAEQSRAEQSRAEQSRAERGLISRCIIIYSYLALQLALTATGMGMGMAAVPEALPPPLTLCDSDCEMHVMGVPVGRTASELRSYSALLQ